MSYALDESRRTIVRASYSRYYQQLAFGNVRARTRRARATSRTAGTTRTATASCSRARSTSTRSATRRVNVANPGSVSADTVNKIDRDRKPRKDDEFIVGSTASWAPASRPACVHLPQGQRLDDCAAIASRRLQRPAQPDEGAPAR